MRFITITLIVHAPDPFTGAQKSTFQQRLGVQPVFPTLEGFIPDPPADKNLGG